MVTEYMKKINSILLALGLTLGSFETVSACGPESYIGTICTVALNFCPAGTLEADGRLLSTNQNQALFSLIGFNYGGDNRANFALPDMRGRSPVGIGTSTQGQTIPLGGKRGQEFVKLTEVPVHTHNFTPTSGSVKSSLSLSGSNTNLTGTVGVVTDTANTTGNLKPVANTAYQMAGTKANVAGGIIGPYTTALLDNDAAKNARITGVSVDASKMTPNINNAPITINGVLVGGEVEAAGNPNASVQTVPPQLGMRYCIVVEGTYPPRP
jgi:microcystin-dependent protein